MEIFLGAFTEAWEQRRAAFLHEQLGGRTTVYEDEERRRRSLVEDATLFRPAAIRRSSHASVTQQPRPLRPMATRFTALARGSQPAMVKMASFAGGGRLRAMAAYISRNGALVMENQAGDSLHGKEATAALANDWADLMGNRAESRDIGSFRIDVDDRPGEGERLETWASDIVKAALGERSFAFAVAEHQGHYRIDGLVVLRDRHGERLSADTKAEEITQRRLAESCSLHAGDLQFRFTGYGNGVDYGSARLRQLVENSAGKVTTDRGETIADAKRAGDLVQLHWRGELHSRKPRDIMHLVMSARAGTDTKAFGSAARDFLAAEFPQHRYVFSLHDPTHDPKGELHGGKRPHVHVHAIVSMRSEDGERVETSIAAFRRWREGLAEHARAHGIRMEMTDRRDQASAPAFSRNQVRAIRHEGRTEHEGTTPSARRRYEDKRREAPSTARTDRSLAYSRDVHRRWSDLARDDSNADVRAFAARQLARLEIAERHLGPEKPEQQGADQAQAQLRTVLLTLSQLTEVDSMKVMTRAEFEAYEQRVEASLARAEGLMHERQRSVFDEIAAAARDHVSVHRDIMEQAEHKAGYAPQDREKQQYAERQSSDKHIARGDHTDWAKIPAEVNSPISSQVKDGRQSIQTVRPGGAGDNELRRQQLEQAARSDHRDDREHRGGREDRDDRD